MSRENRTASSRRTFLKTMGGAFGAAALPFGGDSPASAFNRDAAAADGDPNAYDVVVIGGGFAGVTAARELQHAGLRTVILEARNRLGGRTFTVRVDGEVFDLGGTWIHSTQPHVFAEASRYGLEVIETQGAIPERVLWWDGERAKEAGLGEVLALVEEAICASDEEEIDAPLAALEAFAVLSQQMSDFHAGAAAAFPRPFDPFSSDGWKQADTLSVRDRLDELGLSQGRRGLLEGVLGASAHGAFSEAGFADMLRWWALSGSDIERYMDSVARYRLRDGTVSLIDAMLADGRPDVRVGTPVAEVADDGTQVRVLSEAGEVFTAGAAIAALPMNVLANIHFTPALHPDKLAASRERHAGAGVKVYARVRGELPPLAIFAGESEPFSSVFTLHSEGEGAELVAFGTDPAAIDVHSKAAVQEFLRRFLPEVEVASTLAYDWHLDPYSLGTWCILKKGQMTRYLAALRAPHGRIHFAGGDFALGWRGFIDGAIESGNRAAHEVIARLEGRSAGRSPARAGAVPHARAPGSELTGDAVAFQQCAVCHPTDASGRPGVGPNLRGVVGRPAASDPTFGYSEALRSRSHPWTEAELDAFLADPAAYASGTLMPFAGLKDPADRAAVIRYLRELR